MDWRTLPSLSALRAFEATARLLSFSGAARELNVTHPAIAQHVRGLEADLGLQLVTRQGKGLALTEDGSYLATQLNEGFTTIASGIRDLSSRQQDRPLTLSMTPSFAESWLMPRLGAFWAEHPEIALTVNPSTDLVNLRQDGVDLAVRFGDGTWPDLQVERLGSSPWVVVAAPSYASNATTLSDLGDLTQHRWFGSENANEQRIWGRQIGLDFAKARYTELANNALVNSAVRAGYGLSIQNKAIMQADLNAGNLVALHEGLSDDLDYYLVTRPGRPSEKLKTFLNWIRAQV